MMRDIFTGLCLIFVVPSCFYFWNWIIQFEKKEDKYLKDLWEGCDEKDS